MELSSDGSRGSRGGSIQNRPRSIMQSGCHGVTWHSRDATWQVHYLKKYIGRFKDLPSAIAARRAAEAQASATEQTQPTNVTGDEYMDLNKHETLLREQIVFAYRHLYSQNSDLVHSSKEANEESIFNDVHSAELIDVDGNRIEHMCAFIKPVLAPFEVTHLISWAEEHAQHFAVNSEESAEYQMDELILNTSHPKFIERIAYERIIPAFLYTLGRAPTKFHAQIARYSAGGIAESGWHFDEDSDYTCVVALNSDFTGGGTDLLPDGPLCGSGACPPLPVGTGLFFEGSRVLHRGLPVTEGTRYILVFWMK